MSRTAWISLGLFLLAGAGRSQERDFLMLDELSIKGQVREPAVAIISSRIQPEITGFKLEKSFFDQVRSPDEELVDVDPAMGLGLRIANRDALLERSRTLSRAAWPLSGGSSPETPQTTKAATEDGSGH